MKKLSVTISGHRTSITLEDEFAAALRAIAARENTSIAELIAKIDETRKDKTNLSSAIRIFVFKNAA
ncbi:MAG: ribbon-helix-helix domain-containing protein, partial [Proteobacteria bacterium]|nr:ribbon-helix-helix domain-containing protein [Pseudomonadota bacterium]